MKTRIILDSFNALFFPVEPVTVPAEQANADLEPIGHVLPGSLAEWFGSRGALEVCGTVTAESTGVLESGLLNQQLARSRCCPSRHLRRAWPFAGDWLPAAGRNES